MDERFEKSVFDKLKIRDKIDFLKNIGKSLGFEFESLHNYKKWDMFTTSGEFCIDGYSFVFIPMSDTYIGWDGELYGLSEKEQKCILLDFEEYGMSCSIEDYLNECLQRRRKVSIGPMLAGKHLRGLRNFDQDDTKLGYDAFLSILNNKGYSLPDSNEWEYLSGGERSSIFPWGNDVMEKIDKLLGPAEQSNIKSLLQDENHLGLHIAYDPYVSEIILSSHFEIRGGDGGSALCGGLCPFLGFLPLSPHYVENQDLDGHINGIRQGYRPVIRLASLL